MWVVIIVDFSNKVDQVLFGFAYDSEARDWAKSFNALRKRADSFKASRKHSKNPEFSLKAYAVLAKCAKCKILEEERDQILADMLN